MSVGKFIDRNGLEEGLVEGGRGWRVPYNTLLYADTELTSGHFERYPPVHTQLNKRDSNG